MKSLKAKTVNASIWSLGGFGLGNALRLASNLILARLLVPEMFGVMAIVQIFISGLMLFTDIGLGPSIIQSNRRDDPVFLNTVWTVQVIRGGILFVASLVVAIPAAEFYNNPQLKLLIPAVGVTAIIKGFQSTAMPILSRQLQVKELILIELISQVMGLAVMIAWAYYQRSVWALVAGQIVSSIGRTILSCFQIKGHKDRLAVDKKSLDEIFTFGKWIFASTALMFLANQCDRMVLGKLFNAKLFGLFTIAYGFAEIPKQILMQLNSRVVFPAATYFSGIPRNEYRMKIKNKRNLLNLSCLLLIAVLGAFGDVIIFTLYDDRYIPAAGILPLMAIGIWPFVLYASMDSCLMAIGKPNYKAIGNVFSFLYILIAIPLFFRYWGTLGALVAVLLKELPTYSFVAGGAMKEKISCFRDDFLTTAALGLTLTVFIFLRQMLGFDSPFEQLFNL